ncbi:MAG: ketoacyl-ACP synthase III [Candidatus Margulisbacteria bacterium]|nr:ketoacyl-ACP synthase III [Candidatus Margulisiibacteriota bacterium]
MTNKQRSIGIIGTGSAVPQQVYKNDDFVKLGLDTSDEWIFDRTGIKQRYISKNESASDLAIMAAEKAIKSSGVSPSAIDCIVVATTTPDYPLFPSVACLVQNALGLENVPAFDISAACTGFIYALDVAVGLMRNSNYKNVLVIGADTLSKYCNWKDRSVVILFGDGAGAVVLGDVMSGSGILSSKLGAQGKDYNKLIVPIGGSRTPLTKENVESDQRYIQMEGKAIYKFAVNIIINIIEEALQKAKLKKEDICFFIPHQANKRIIDYARDKLGLSSEQVYVNIDRYGNTSAASIPIAIDETSRKGLLKKGDILVTVGFGAGLTYGTNVIKWSK